MNEAVDLTRCEMFEYDGVHRKKLNGQFTSEDLAGLFIEEWIPFTECGKCGRSDYCKYVQPYPNSPDRLREIKCGVAVDAMKNFVSGTFHLLSRMPRNQVEHYLDGAFYLCQVIHEAEQAIGSCVSREIVGWFGELAPLIYGRLARLRKEWNSLNRSLRHISDFYSQTRGLFVEGDSEKLFIERLGKPGLELFPGLEIEVYGGKGNRHLKRIGMLLDDYGRRGHKIYMEGDADGKNTDIFRSLVAKGKVDDDHTFQFQHDFETAVPPELLWASLRDLGELHNVPVEDFVEAATSIDRSVVQIIKARFGLDIEPIKCELAKAIAERINGRLLGILDSPAFKQSELGKFVEFVRRAR